MNGRLIRHRRGAFGEMAWTMAMKRIELAPFLGDPIVCSHCDNSALSRAFSCEAVKTRVLQQGDWAAMLTG
jgi:hypothetical protein